MSITFNNVRDQVAGSLVDSDLTKGVDVDAVATEIIQRFGCVDIDTIDFTVYWEIVHECDVDSWVTLYETNAENIVVECDGRAWNLGPLRSEMTGFFIEDAKTWLNDAATIKDWPFVEETHLEGLRAVARSDGARLLFLASLDTIGPIPLEYAGPPF